tara:strand:- start:57 stop:257 length:201 start_codon:yes stop_codon:yes gene_type:complete
MAKLSNKDLLLEIQRDLQEIKKNIFVMKTDVNQIKSYIQIKRSEVKEENRDQKTIDTTEIREGWFW